MFKELKLLISRAKKQDHRALARLISLSENDPYIQRQIVKEIYKSTGQAHVIGITGSPGAGKSTLVDCLALSLRSGGKKVAILAIDPSSPFTGGAILGDRIRMSGAVAQANIFVRSMASRGALGGLSYATLSSIYILDAAKFDYILVETVGVGQGEVDIARCADTCLVVLVPGMGDEVQSVKAGILEIADLFVINKADRDGVNSLERDLISLINLISYQSSEWKILVNRTVATVNKGIKELHENISKHRKWYRTSNDAQKKRMQTMKSSILELSSDLVRSKISLELEKELTVYSHACLKKALDPYSAATKLLQSIKSSI